MEAGHVGVENRTLYAVRAGNFQVVLSALIQMRGHAEIVIHASWAFDQSAVPEDPDLQYGAFFLGLGLNHFPGMCPFHGNRCFFRVLGTIEGFGSWVDLEARATDARRRCELFAGSLPELYSVRLRDMQIRQNLNLEHLSVLAFAPLATLTIAEGTEPAWAESVKFPRLRELESQAAEANREIEELRAFAPLLYGSGEPLESAVVAALRYFGLATRKTVKGETVDVLATETATGRDLGVEVTGTDGPINKSSRKLTQVLRYEQIKRDSDKTILLANTQRSTPVGDRAAREDFTQPAVEFLANHPVLLITGWDLYRLIGDVLSCRRERAEVVASLFDLVGLFKYNGSA
jgi:hypothetical protein